MSLRAKTKHRLLIVLACAVSSAAVLGGAYAWRRTVIRSKALHAKDLGFAAAKAHDYDAALPEIGQYLARFPNDTEALYYYSLARENVEEPNGRNLMEAIGLFRHLLDLQPGNLDGRRELLDLYVRVGFKTETLDAADALLKLVPDDPTALHDKALAQVRLRQFDAALATIEHCNKIHPENMDNQILALMIRSSRGDASADILRSTEALQKAHPADPHFDLLVSIAQVNAGDQPAAAAAARAAAALPTPDADTLTRIVRQLDALALYPDAIAAAQAAAARHPADIDYRRFLAARILIAGDYPQLAALLKDITPSNANADPQLLALKGLSLIFQDRPKDALPFFDAIAQHHADDKIASALASAAQATAIDTTDAAKSVKLCEKALSADPTNPFLQFCLGQAYARQGAGEPAVRAWQSASRTAPAWAAPIVSMSRALLSAGQYPQALTLARAAQLRAPNDEQTLLALASAWAATITPQNSKDTAQLLDLLQTIESRFPAANQIRPTHVNLLAHLDRRAEALRIAKETLASSPPPSENTLLQLAAVSQANHLNLDQDCFALSEKAHGMTPLLAFTKALFLQHDGHPDQGLTFLESVLPKQNPSAQWQLAQARYLDLIHDPKATQAWTALATAFPDDLSVQWAAIETPSLQSNHVLLGKIIDGIRAKVGDEDSRGRLARARWLVQGSPSDKDISEAAVLLSDVTHADPGLVEARLLLAHCMQKLGNTSGAVDQLRAAAQARPDVNAIALEFAHLLIDQGETDDAHVQLDHVAQNNPSPSDRQQAAALYTQLGDLDQATALLQTEPATADGGSGGLMLATLYAKQNQFAKAEDICRGLMQSPTPQVIQLYATLLASQKRMSEAQAVLAKLDSLHLAPGVREFTRAGFMARFDTPEHAGPEYRAAAHAAPHNAAIWRQWLSYLLNVNKMDDAASVVPEAHEALPADPAFAALNDNLPLLHALAADPDARALFNALLETPRNSAGILDGLKLLADIQARKIAPDQYLPKLHQLADQNSQVLALQSVAVLYLAHNGQMDDAIAIATRAMQAFPNAPEAAQLAAASLAAAGHWNEALAAATQWRARSETAPLQADMLIAEANMHLGNIDVGLHQLQPYIAHATQKPDEVPGILLLYTEGLLASKKTDQAAHLLQPLLTSPSWRSAYIRFAIRLPDEKEAAQWLKTAAAAIPATAAAEKGELAIAYQDFAVRTHNPAYRQVAVDILKPLAARPDCDPQIPLILGSLYENQENLPAAEQAYRHSLQIKADQPIVLNNLAMVLVHENADTSEALADVAKAIKLAPSVPNFYDTQASVFAHQKAYDRALVSIGEAIKLAPTNPEWQASRIWLLALAGQKQTAAAEFHQLQTTQSVVKLSPDARQRLLTIGLK